jgi:Peptidase family S41/PDZ domain
MHRICLGLTLTLAIAAAGASGQAQNARNAPNAERALTEAQRIHDLNQTASFYSKNYAPYERKRELFGFDLLRLNRWYQEIHRADDLDFQDVLVDYVASLKDAHSVATFPANFAAELPIRFDIYDGRVLIDAIDRTALPLAQFPFGVGDELIAFDGMPVRDVIKSLQRYAEVGSPALTDRLAADTIGFRGQWFIPHAPDIGDTAVLLIRLNGGVKNRWTVPWFKSGTAITSQGPVPSPGRRSLRMTGRLSANVGGLSVQAPGPRLRERATDDAVDDTLPGYMESLRPLLNASVPRGPEAVLNFGSKIPIYAPPPGFVLRRGGPSSDFFLTGTFQAAGRRIGFIRIPSFSPASTSVALQQLDQEIAFFNVNTDGLVIDVMRNPGGLLLFCEAITQRLMPAPFQTVGYEVRATATWLNSFANTLLAAQQGGAPPEILANLQANYDAVLDAYNENRGLSTPVALNAFGSLTVSPAAVRYTKPLLVLVDGFTASAGDQFAAIIQDNGRAPLFGMRTMGAGGSVRSYPAVAYSEAILSVTLSLMNRGRVIQTPDYPPTPYIENVGVRPDIVNDYMTRQNLMTGGAPFVQAFTAAILNLIQSGGS